MAITVDGGAAVGNSTSSGTTLAFAPSTTLEVGKVILAAFALDNTATTDGTTSEITQIQDTGGNTWALLGAFRNGQAGAAAGAQAELWKSKITTQLTTGSTITATFPNTITAKCTSLIEVSVGAGKSLQNSFTPMTGAEDNDSNPAALTHFGLSNIERLYVRVIAIECRASDVGSPTTNYTAFTPSSADTGAAATSMTAQVEYRVLTGTGDTSDPGGLGNTRDMASIYFALEEVSVGGSAYDLDCAAGSYAVTGAALTPAAAMLLNAAAGGYALTGAALTPAAAMLLNAAAGSYAITGAAITAPAAMLLNAAAGAYAITGAAATLSRAVTLNAEAGAYILTGADAVLPAGLVINAAAGSYLISGPDAVLFAAMLLNAESGSLVITGADATFVVESVGAYELDAEAGSYAITGANATLKADIVIEVSPGVYQLTGEEVTLSVTSGGIVDGAEVQVITTGGIECTVLIDSGTAVRVVIQSPTQISVLTEGGTPIKVVI
jgi:hypothetical protein